MSNNSYRCIVQVSEITLCFSISNYHLIINTFSGDIFVISIAIFMDGLAGIKKKCYSLTFWNITCAIFTVETMTVAFRDYWCTIIKFGLFCRGLIADNSLPSRMNSEWVFVAEICLEVMVCLPDCIIPGKTLYT